MRNGENKERRGEDQDIRAISNISRKRCHPRERAGQQTMAERDAGHSLNIEKKPSARKQVEKIPARRP